MKVKIHDPNIEIRVVNGDKENGDFNIESHGEITVSSDVDGDLFLFNCCGKLWKIINDDGCVQLERCIDEETIA
jgi:hypothetical protein